MSFYGIRDFLQLGITSKRGWHFPFMSKLEAMSVVVPGLEDKEACLAFAEVVDSCLEERQ